MRPAALVLLAALQACTAPERADASASTDDAGETGASEHALEATLTPGEPIGTLAYVTFATPAPGSAWVEVQEDGGPVRVFPATADVDGTGHSAMIVGLAAATDYTWRAVATLEDGATLDSAPAVFATDPPPLWLPALTEVVPAADPWAPGFVMTTFIGQTAGAALFDHQGRYVWWWEPPEGEMPCQARLGLDGRSVTIMVIDELMSADIGTLVQVEIGGAIRASHRATNAHHDFIELPDGRIGFLAFDIRKIDGMDVVGDALVLLDTTTGAEEVLWSTWDDFEPIPDDEEEDAFYQFGMDWTHGNGLARDAATGEWLVSLHNLDTLVRLSSEGELLWRIGGPEDGFTLLGGERFANQHSPVLTESGILLFDNKTPDIDALYSRAVEYRVDLGAGTLEEIWSFDGEQDLYSAFMGAVERTHRGTTLIGWGSGGRLTEVDADGNVVWQVETAVGSSFGFTRPVRTLGEVVE